MGSFRDSRRLKWDRNSLDADGRKALWGALGSAKMGCIICGNMRAYGGMSSGAGRGS